MANFEFPDGETIRSRLQRVPGMDPRITEAETIRSRLQRVPGVDPRLATAASQTPLMGPPQGSPADMVRSRIQQIPGTADPRVARPLVGPPQNYGPGATPSAAGGVGAPPAGAAQVARSTALVPSPQPQRWYTGEGPAAGRVGPGGVGKPMVRAPAPEGWIARAARAAMGAEPGVAPAAANKTGLAYKTGKAAGRLAAKVPEAGLSVARQAPRMGAISELGGGLLDLADQGPTLRNAVRTGVGLVGQVNPHAAMVATGMAGANLVPDSLYERGMQAVGLMEKPGSIAGPELNKTLAGRTPTQYLAERSATSAGSPAATQADVRRSEPAESLPMGAPGTMGLSAEDDYAPELRPIQGAARSTRGTATSRQAGAAPTATSAPPLLGADDDEVEVIYGNRGSVLHRFGENGDTQRIDVAPGQTKEQARANYIARLAVDQQVSELMATGAPVPPELIKNYYLAHGLDPKDLLRDEANLQGEQIRADSAGNVANINAGSQKYQTDSTASLARDGSKEKTRASHVLNEYDEYGMPKGQRIGVVDLQTGSELGKPAQSYPTPSVDSIDRLRKKGKNAAEVKLFESRYGPGSAAQYLQAAEKPKGYAKGGLIRGYAQGGVVGNDYQAGETDEEYALRTRSSAGAPSAVGAPSEGFSADKVFGMAGANYSANPAFGRIGEHYAQGGPVRGPGSGTSDSVPALIDGVEPAAISDGEYVIPAAVVKRLGVKFFDNLIAKNQSGKTR